MVASCLAVALLGCGPSLRRLDEAPLLRAPGLELKVVRYYENLPLHFNGEIAVVQCRSEQTKDRPAGRANDAGWVPLGRAAALGTSSAEEVVDRARQDYEVVAGDVLAWKGTVLMLTTDGCASFVTWDPTTLPAEWIDRAPRPEFCQPVGHGDCRYFDFEGDRRPVFDEIQVTGERTISFRARSKGLAAVEALRVTSNDAGATWSFEPVEVP